MASYPREIDLIATESTDLRQRLAGLEANQKRTLKDQRKVNMELVKKSDFVDKSPRLMNVQPKVKSSDYETLKSTLKSKNEKLEQQKTEYELAGCTFRPELNKNTEALLLSYVSVLDKPLPRKEQPPAEESRKEIEQQSPDNSQLQKETKAKQRPNMQFYEQQMEWKNSIEEAKLRERLQKEEQNQKKPIAQPTLNTSRNNELVKKEGDFLTRVQQDMERSKEVRSRLEQKVYGEQVLTFAPKIKPMSGVSSKVNK